MEKAPANVKRIAILGAESTGKTTLAKALALRYHTSWVPEYAREYMSTHPGDYDAEDIVKMTQVQLEQERALLPKAERFLFSDTELITAKVWCEDVFGNCPSWLEENMLKHRYDLYLLTANDLPWVPDPVRMNPQRRDYFFNWYKRELEHYGMRYEVIRGRYEQRLLNAIKAVEGAFA